MVNELSCEATSIIRSNVNKELLRRSPLNEVRLEHFSFTFLFLDFLGSIIHHTVKYCVPISELFFLKRLLLVLF